MRIWWGGKGSFCYPLKLITQSEIGKANMSRTHISHAHATNIKSTDLNTCRIVAPWNWRPVTIGKQSARVVLVNVLDYKWEESGSSPPFATETHWEIWGSESCSDQSELRGCARGEKQKQRREYKIHHPEFLINQIKWQKEPVYTPHFLASIMEIKMQAIALWKAARKENRAASMKRKISCYPIANLSKCEQIRNYTKERREFIPSMPTQQVLAIITELFEWNTYNT